jgi:hypothetical protein
MKKILLLSFAALLFAGNCHAQVETPPHAASTRTWTFGGLVWSDAIQIPACNKTDFKDSNTSPDCRSYAGGSETWYYYNWAYVKKNQNTLCPAPWRVPSEGDFGRGNLQSNVHIVFNPPRFPGIIYHGEFQAVGKVVGYWTTDTV